MDEQDTIVAYEERGKQAQASKMTSYESGMQALEGMGRINQVEAIHGKYNLYIWLTLLWIGTYSTKVVSRVLAVCQ